jgi:hypothetical protein
MVTNKVRYFVDGFLAILKAFIRHFIPGKMKKIENLIFVIAVLALSNFSCTKDNASPPKIVTTSPPAVSDTIPGLLLGKWNVILENDTSITDYGTWLLVSFGGINFLDGSYAVFKSDGTFFENVTYLDSLGVVQTFTTSLYFTVKGNEIDMHTAKDAPISGRYFIVELTGTDFIYYQTKIFSSTSLKQSLFLSR